MNTETFSWHAEAVLYTPQGCSIFAKDCLVQEPDKIHPLAAFFKLLQDGHAPLVKSDGTSVVGPKIAFRNMFYSSSGGSTGKPKLICRSCKSWLLSFTENVSFFALTEKKSYATLGDLSHSLTLYAALEALTTGADYYPLGGLRASQQLKHITQHRIQILYATPTQLRILTKSADLESRLTAVRWVMIGGGWLDDETKKRVQKLCPSAELKEFYGASETSFVTISDPFTPLGSVGRSYKDVQIQILDAQENEVKAGNIGEIWIKSPYLFSHYAEGEKQQTRWHNGWLSIGEIGKLDTKGNLYLVGRKSRTFKIADQNIYPDEIEAVLCRHPDIGMASVVDLPDKMRGAIAVGVIATNSSEIPQDMWNWCRQYLSPRSRPAKFFYLSAEEWPLLTSGKPDMKAIRTMVEKMI